MKYTIEEYNAIMKPIRDEIAKKNKADGRKTVNIENYYLDQ